MPNYSVTFTQRVTVLITADTDNSATAGALTGEGTIAESKLINIAPPVIVSTPTPVVAAPVKP